MAKKWLRFLIITVPIIAIVAGLVIIQPWDSSPDAHEVIAQASTAVSDIQSYRMTFSGTKGGNGPDAGLMAEIMFSSPDRSHLKITIDGLTNEYIHIGEIKYIQDEEKLTGWPVIFNTSYVLNQDVALEMLDQLINIQVLADEKVDGVNCFHFRGQYPESPVYQEMLDKAREGLSEEQARQVEKEFNKSRTVAEVDIWISKDDYLLRQEQMRISNLEGRNLENALLKFSDFDQPIMIEPPLDSVGQLLPGWRLE